MRDYALLQRFRLCRSDFVSALSKSSEPPSSKTLRELADLQLAIMATEAAISDKSDVAPSLECGAEGVRLGSVN